MCIDLLLFDCYVDCCGLLTLCEDAFHRQVLIVFLLKGTVSKFHFFAKMVGI